MNIAYADLLSRLDDAETVEAVWQEAERFFLEHDITHAIYVYARGYKNTPEDTIVLSTMPGWWMEKYQREGYAAIDPFFTYCCQTYESMRTGVEYFEDYDYLNDDERHFILEAAKTGFRSGSTFIMRRQGVGSDFGGWNLGTSLSRDAFEALYAEKGEVLRIVAMYIHEQINLRLHKDAKETAKYQEQVLSKRQVDCLQLLCEGFRTQQIADRLSIQPITVEHHIKLAKEKLQATTREQAIARAIIKGLITP